MVKEVKQAHWGTLKVLEKWETANPNWQPRKGISLVNKELADKWYSPATKQDIVENYMQMLQLPRSELEKAVKDENKPMLIRIIAKSMLSWKWFDIIEKMLDRWVWRGVQTTEHTGANWWPVQVQQIALTEEQQKIIAKRILEK